MKRFGEILKKLLFSLLIFSAVMAKGTTGYPKKFQFENPVTKSITVPFRLINNLIILPLQINNSDTLNFILDSGMSGILLTELTRHDSVQLGNTRSYKIKGLGKGNTVKAIVSTGNKVTIGKIIGENREIYVLTENILRLSTKLGIKINGIIGFPIFESFIIKVDYQRNEITFYDPGYFNKKRFDKRFECLPFTMENGKPYTTLLLKRKDGRVISIKVLIDSGASHAIWFDPTSENEAALPDSTKLAYLGYGLNGDVFGRIGRLNGLRIGTYELNEFIACFPDSSVIPVMPGTATRDGSIGGDILKRFNVIFDYSNNKFYFRKNANFNEAFYYNMSGVVVETAYAGLPVYLVTNIDSGSPGYKCGLQVGDQIIQVKGLNAKDLKLNEIEEILEGKQGNKVKLKIWRNGNVIKTVLYLRKYV